jgi:hypothetical protein
MINVQNGKKSCARENGIENSSQIKYKITAIRRGIGGSQLIAGRNQGVVHGPFDHPISQGMLEIRGLATDINDLPENVAESEEVKTK